MAIIALQWYLHPGNGLKFGNDTSGFVVFIDELFRFLISQPDIDGIMLNLKKEEAVFDKEMMKKVLSMMEQG